MKEERFKSMFAAFGTVTDCSLKFTKEGKFRKFGFVGFKSEEDASCALKHFNKSFVDTSRVTVRAVKFLTRNFASCFQFYPRMNSFLLLFSVQVEMCKAFGDPTKSKSWSKHTQKSEQDKPSAPSKPADNKKVTAGKITAWFLNTGSSQNYFEYTHCIKKVLK